MTIYQINRKELYNKFIKELRIVVFILETSIYWLHNSIYSVTVRKSFILFQSEIIIIRHL